MSVDRVRRCARRKEPVCGGGASSCCSKKPHRGTTSRLLLRLSVAQLSFACWGPMAVLVRAALAEANSSGANSQQRGDAGGGAPPQGAQQQQESNPGRLRSLADEALVSGKADEALRLLGRAVALEPLNEKNLFKRSRVYQRARKPSLALMDLDATLRLAPEYGEALLSRAKLLASMGRCLDAASDFKLASAAPPPRNLNLARDRAEAVDGLARAEECAASLNAARAAFERGDFRAQIQHLSFVLESTKTPPAHLILERAKAYYEVNDLYEAIADAGRALKENPDDVAALELRGAAYYKLADHAMAKTHWQQGLKLDPEHKGCKTGYKLVRALSKKDAAGDAAAAEGRHDDAIAAFQSALDVDPDHATYAFSAHLKIATAQLASKKHADAVASCDAALKIDDASVDAHLRRAEALVGDERFDDAVRAAKRARELDDSDRTRKAQAKAEAALKQSKSKNYYKILGVKRDAATKEIKKAYRDLALKYHPDKLAADVSDADKETALAKFQEIAQAYEILSDDETRAKYDRGEDVGQPGAGQGGHPGGRPGPGMHGFPHGFPGFSSQGGQQRFHFQFR